MIKQTLQKMTNSSTMITNELVKDLRNKGNDIIGLGFGQSPFPPPPELVDKLKAHAATNEYLPVQGYLPLRENIAAHYSQRDGRHLTADDVVIGPGTKQLQFLLQLAMRQPQTFVHVPCWVSYSAHCKIVNRKIRPLYTRFLDDWKLQDQKLETVKKTAGLRLFILATPNNPTGTTYTETELQHMATSLDDPEIVFLLDEIYSELAFDGPMQSLAKYSPSQAIISSGISKSLGAGGWRLGYLVFPPELAELRKTVVALASETHSCATTPVQYACQDLFTSPSYQTYHAKSRKILAALTSYCAQIFQKSLVRVVKPNGGWYLFLDFMLIKCLLNQHNISNSVALSQQLLKETHVSSTPGSNFLQPKTDINLRLCLVDFDGQAALDACSLETEIGDDWLETHCARTITVCKRIRDWVQNLKE